MSNRDFQVTDVNVTKEIRDLKNNVNNNKENRLLAGTGIHIDRTLNRTIITATGDTESKLQPIYLSVAEYQNMLAQGPDSFIEGSLYVVDNNSGIEDDLYIPLQPKFDGLTAGIPQVVPLYEMSIQNGTIRPQTTKTVRGNTITREYKLYTTWYRVTADGFTELSPTEWVDRTLLMVVPNLTLIDVKNASIRKRNTNVTWNDSVSPVGFNVTLDVVGTAQADKYIKVTLDEPFTTAGGWLEFEIVYHNLEQVDE